MQSDLSNQEVTPKVTEGIVMKHSRTVVFGGILAAGLLLSACSATPPDDASPRNGSDEDKAAAGSGIQVRAQPNDQGNVILNAITGAKISVDIPIYDIGGDQIEAALKTAKQNGVSIRIMINGGYGSYPPGAQELLADLTAAPGAGTVKVNWSSNNFSITHQKSVIVDAADKEGNAVAAGDLPQSARLVISTGNFASFQSEPFWSARDYDMSTQDPDLVTTVEGVFLSDFQCSSRTTIDPASLTATDRLVWSNGTTGANATDAVNEYPSISQGYPGYWDFPKTAVDRGNSADAYARIIDAAKQGDVLRFSNEELKDETIVNKLTAAATRGADVRINMTLPRGYDPTSPDESNKDLWGVWQIVKAGGTAHMFTNNSQVPDALYIHAKFVSLNSSELMVGSENASTPSLQENRELGINLTSVDQPAIDTIIATFDEDWSKDTSWVTIWNAKNVPDTNVSSALIRASQEVPYVDAEVQRKDLQLAASDSPQTCGPVIAAPPDK
jgi:cardiolipin synthase